MKSFVKLSTIAAASTLLVACAGGGGGGPIADSTNWNTGTPVKDVTIADGVLKAGYADVAVAHKEGWKGQGMAAFTISPNWSADGKGFWDSNTGKFISTAQLVGPEGVQGSEVLKSFNAFESKNTFANQLDSMQTFSMIGTSVAGAQALVKKEIAAVPATETSASIANKDITVQAVTLTTTSVIRNEGTKAVFDKIQLNSVDKSSVINLKENPAEIARMAGYVVGSTGIIASKFVNLRNDELVRLIDQSRIDGAFSLGKALSPSGPLK